MNMPLVVSLLDMRQGSPNRVSEGQHDRSCLGEGVRARSAHCHFVSSAAASNVSCF